MSEQNSGLELDAIDPHTGKRTTFFFTWRNLVARGLAVQVGEDEVAFARDAEGVEECGDE